MRRMRLAIALTFALASPAWAAPCTTANVFDFGAVGDVRFADDCAMTSGSNVLNCGTHNHFSPLDVGKSITVYGAGTLVGSIQQPLSTTITGYTAQSLVSLGSNAATTTYVSPTVWTPNTAYGLHAVVKSFRWDTEKVWQATVAGTSGTVEPNWPQVDNTTVVDNGVTWTTAEYPRVVWGTDDTAHVQAAVDSLAATVAGTELYHPGVLYIPKGHYYVKRLQMPCSRIGNFPGYGSCTKSYNNITIRGDGIGETILENLDVAATDQTAIIELAAFTESPFLGSFGNSWLENVTVTGLTVRQITHSTSRVRALGAGPSKNLRIVNNEFIGSDVETVVPSGGTKVLNLELGNNYCHGGGKGGILYPNSTACFNVAGGGGGGTGTYVHDNIIWDSGQCFESGGHGHTVYENNRCYGLGHNTGLSHLGWNIGSTGVGIWDMVVHGNTIQDVDDCFLAANGIGTLGRFTIDSNVLSNCIYGFDLRSGFATNSVVEGDSDTVTHGMTFVTNNLIRNPLSVGIILGGHLHYESGLESYTVANNRVVFDQTLCNAGANNGKLCYLTSECPTGACEITGSAIGINYYGGGPGWTPGATVNWSDYVRPSVHNGFMYRATTAGGGGTGTTGTSEPAWCTTLACTVADNNIVWTIAGPAPTAIVDGLTVQAPLGGHFSSNPLVNVSDNTSRDSVRFSHISSNLAWQFGGDDVATLTNVPAQAEYGDLRRWWDALPTAGLFSVGMQITKLSASTSNLGYSAIRSGRAAPVWSSTTHNFGDTVVPTADNGHAYMDITVGVCSTGGGEPVWSTVAGSTTGDGGCTWKEVGSAVLWAKLQGVVP